MPSSPLRSRLIASVALCLLGASRSGAVEDWKSFIAGATSGLAVHEGSHLALDLAFDADPRLKGVKFGPIPFFAVTHRSGLTDRREALISGAGFVSQHVYAEIALSRRPPGGVVSSFSKGAMAFHVATSVAYAGAAFTRYGPYERDTRGIADSTGTDERLVGALVLAPAAFDTWRYFRPESKTARWGSRLAKAAFIGVIAFKK